MRGGTGRLAGGLAACLVAAFLPGSARASATAEGDFDATYGYGGRSYDWTFDQGSMPFEPAVAVMADGRVVVANSDQNGYAGVVRYRANGTLDSSFGVDGRSSPVASGTGIVGRRGIAVDATGRVLLGGSIPVGGSYQAAIFRFTSSGSPDLGFGVQGRATIPIGSGQDSVATAINVLPSGKIVVGGSTGNAMFLTRLSDAGGIDTSFGSGGYATTNVNSSTTTVNDIAVHRDGRIVAVGDESSNGFSGFAVTSWTAGGQPDSSLSGGGELADAFLDLSSSVHDHANAVALQPDGKILVGGTISWADPDIAVVRYNADGSRDSSFGFSGSGVWNANLSSTDETVHDLWLQRDGKPVLFGDADVGGSEHYDHIAARLTTAGLADPAFGTSGTTGFDILDFDGLYDHTYAGRVFADGRILGAGASFARPSMYKVVGDLVPPGSPTARVLPRFSLARSVTLTWSKPTDDNTGVKSYDVLTQSTKYSSSPGPAGVFRSALVSRTTSFPRKTGYTRCFVVKARDYAGNVGTPGNQVCTAFPVDDRTLTVHGSWSKGSGSAYYLGSYRRSTKAGAALTVGVQFRRLVLVATTCSACGKVKVYVGKTLLKAIDLRSAGTHIRRIVPVVTFSTSHTGTLRIVQASGGKPVTIDGVGVSYW